MQIMVSAGGPLFRYELRFLNGWLRGNGGDALLINAWYVM
jgi:hypothetical protein